MGKNDRMAAKAARGVSDKLESEKAATFS